jgi:Glycosyl hydrolase-like 10
LYADILLWLKEGWIDYVAPQLYWEFGHKAAPYEVLLDWWGKHTYGKQCYIGLGIYRAGSNAAWRDKTQLPRMITAMRNTPNINGAIYFSSKTFERNPNGWNDSLRENYYKYPAVIPAMSWVDTSVIAPPGLSFSSVAAKGNAAVINIENKETTKKIKAFIIYRFSIDDTIISSGSAKNIIKIIPATANAVQYTISSQENGNGVIAASCIDFENNESNLAMIQPAGN